ncbi:MAG: pyridoxamine 5'-phosphate oxidase family protein [Thermoplasmata archaeon]|nr:pyridoxamine 5'-phosphate oxidase family protein [Thermoplasmata archaeon]
MPVGPNAYDTVLASADWNMPVLTDEMKRIVRQQRLGFVASVSADGHPNVSPKGSLTVWDGDRLVFADIESPRTIRNLASNPNTEVNVVDPAVRKGYRFSGVAKILRTGELYWKILEHYKEEGADIRRVRAIVVIDVTAASPVVSPCYLTGLTEDEVRAIWAEWHRKADQKTVVDLIPPNDF